MPDHSVAVERGDRTIKEEARSPPLETVRAQRLELQRRGEDAERICDTLLGQSADADPHRAILPEKGPTPYLVSVSATEAPRAWPAATTPR